MNVPCRFRASRACSLVAFSLLASCGGGGGGGEGGVGGGESPAQVDCKPGSFGAVADGKTDDTVAIQNAIDSCAAQGGGTVELADTGGGAIYLTGPITLKSHVTLRIGEGVTLQATHDHSRYVAAYVNWVYQPNEALISARRATDVAITGSGTIDGAGDIPDPNDGGRTWHDVGALEDATIRSLRPYVLEFYECDHVTVTGVTIRNHPYWAQAFRYSRDIVETGVTIDGIGRNSDGVDLVGVTNVTLSNLDIRVSDDFIAVKSGLPIRTTDSYYAKEIGLPEMPTAHVRISNITGRDGQGISIGSEAVNGVSDVTIENVTLVNSRGGFRVKTGRDRGSQIHDITVKNFVMNGGAWPLIFDTYYSAIGSDPRGPAYPITPTTPYIHDIHISDFVATNVRGRSYIHGLPESCIKNLTLDNVNIQTAGLGIELLHVTGTFTNVTSIPDSPTLPFEVLQNVNVSARGTTAEIPRTPPLAGQPACDA